MKSAAMSERRCRRNGTRRPASSARRSVSLLAAALGSYIVLATAPGPVKPLAKPGEPAPASTEKWIEVDQVPCATVPHQTRCPNRLRDDRRAAVDAQLQDHELEDGLPLRGRQESRFLRPQHEGRFGFRDFLLLGDYETMTFVRWTPNSVTGSPNVKETWNRTTTRMYAGRLVSVFNLEWNASVLREQLSEPQWGVDKPVLYVGNVIGPDELAYPVFLHMAPPNIPPSPVVRISDHLQYASHVVNIRDDAFGEDQVRYGMAELTREMARLFYEHFEDAYEVLATVTQVTQVGVPAGTHGTVRNDIRGLGIPLQYSFSG